MVMRTDILVPQTNTATAYQTRDRDNSSVLAGKPFSTKNTAARVVFIAAVIACGLLVIYFDSRHGTLTTAEGVIMLSVFVGSVVSGLVGFAFSAIAGSLMMHWMTPLETVPVLITCSIITQLFSIASLQHSIEWRRFLVLCSGGMVGIPIGAMLIEHVSARIFAVGIGALLIFYSAIMLIRPVTQVRDGGLVTDLVAGLAGGVTGGSIAFPGAIPSLWYCLKGVSKETQRGTIQPFVLVMQVATLLYFSKLGLLSVTIVGTFMRCVPAVVGGTLIGLMVFRGVGDTIFRRVVLFLLLFSGIGLAV